MTSAAKPSLAPPGPIALWLLRLGALWVAAMALWRIVLYLHSLATGLRLPVREASLTFMWIPDLIFLGLFVTLAIATRHAGKRLYIETGLVASALQIAFLVATTLIFRRWTEAAAFGFADPLTWMHAIVPSLWCAWFFLYLLVRLWRLERGGSEAPAL
ncbi:MAG: hypothetical protein Kilf2KO_39960 [Rhodospirillales bacterium]